jgi:uncharacterized membrane protein YgcG
VNFRVLALSVATLAVGGAAFAGTPAPAADRPRGHDVSAHQKGVDRRKARAEGARFVHVKATESTGYRDPRFGQQYDGARDAGIIRGAYHFALQDRSSGRAQAAYFVRDGGAWSADGWTLPPALDIEYNPLQPVRRDLHDRPRVGHLHGRQRRLRRRPRPRVTRISSTGRRVGSRGSPPGRSRGAHGSHGGGGARQSHSRR